MKNKIECPLVGLIEDSICFDISMVAEGMAPERTAPKEARKEGYKEICLKCKNHNNE